MTTSIIKTTVLCVLSLFCVGVVGGDPQREPVPLPAVAKAYGGTWVVLDVKDNCTFRYREPTQGVEPKSIRYLYSTACRGPINNEEASVNIISQYYLYCPAARETLEFARGFDRAGKKIKERINPYSGHEIYAGPLHDRSKVIDAMDALGFPMKPVQDYKQVIIDKYCK